jgi:regulator of RNase E activity RraA
MSVYWQEEEELFAIARRELFTAVVGDIMDKLKLTRQFLPPQIQPLDRNMVAVGRSMTVLEADFFDEALEGTHNPVTAMPFGLMLDALDDLRRNEVYVCTGASPSYALWGELMSTRAVRCGAVGAVVDGYSRDTRGLLAMKFPTFSIGSYAQDQGARGKVVDFRIPIQIGQARIEPGDIIFGDRPGGFPDIRNPVRANRQNSRTRSSAVFRLHRSRARKASPSNPGWS